MTPKQDPSDQLPTADWDRTRVPAPAVDSQSPTASPVPSDEQPTLPQPPRSGIAVGPSGDGRYVLLDEVASGAMGVVYRAEDRVVGRRVALKMIRAGLFACAAEVERFTREARALAQLSHPHVVQVYDFGESEGRPFFTMQLASGGTLAGHLDRFGADARVAGALVEKVARGVQHAHEQGILHRDLKPANVLLGAGDEPLVSDFGLVKFLHAEEQGLTQAGVMPGTPPYMAPEQAAGRSDEVGPRTDVWALGVILYELLVGRRPFEGKTREEILHRILTTSVPPLRSEIDDGVEAIVMKCLEKEPARRYQTAGALAEALDRWLRGVVPAPPPARPAHLPNHIRRRRLWAAGGGIVVVLALAAGAGLFLTRPGKQVERPITLIDESGHPAEDVVWVAGIDGKTMLPSDEGFSFSTPKFAAVQLRLMPPWESYILEAEVRHESGPSKTAGVFVGCTPYQSKSGPRHFMWCAGICDQGALANQLSVGICKIPVNNPVGALGNNCWRETVNDPPKAGAKAPWRKIRVAVTPGGLKASSQGPMECSQTTSELRICGDALLDAADGLNWDSMPRGGIGVYVDHTATASFKNVIVRPFKEGP